MKRLLLVLLVLTAFLAFATASQAAMVLKLGHYANAEHAGNKAAQMFADGLAKRTNGEVPVEIYPNNELGNPPEVLEQSVPGVIDMSIPTRGSWLSTPGNSAA
jgi:TRAP-type C4-dicarboxylate transport system substrate-binding protein